MKTIIIMIAAVLAVSIGGYTAYRSFFAGAQYGSVNMNLGAVDEKAVAVCKAAREGESLRRAGKEIGRYTLRDVAG